jgi:hypothetical protein
MDVRSSSFLNALPGRLIRLAGLAGVVGLLVGCEPLPGSGTSTSSGGSSSSGSSSGSKDAGTSSTSTPNGRQALDAQALCTRLINECGAQRLLQECVSSFGPVRVTPACVSGIARATCVELTAASSSVLTACFPPCSGTIATCNADGTLTQCTVSGTSQVVDCNAACVAQGFATWTGTCALSFQGQVSERPQCWCK